MLYTTIDGVFDNAANKRKSNACRKRSHTHTQLRRIYGLYACQLSTELHAVAFVNAHRYAANHFLAGFNMQIRCWPNWEMFAVGDIVIRHGCLCWNCSNSRVDCCCCDWKMGRFNKKRFQSFSSSNSIIIKILCNLFAKLQMWCIVVITISLQSSNTFTFFFRSKPTKLDISKMQAMCCNSTSGFMF